MLSQPAFRLLRCITTYLINRTNVSWGSTGCKRYFVATIFCCSVINCDVCDTIWLSCIPPRPTLCTYIQRLGVGGPWSYRGQPVPTSASPLSQYPRSVLLSQSLSVSSPHVIPLSRHPRLIPLSLSPQSSQPVIAASPSFSASPSGQFLLDSPFLSTSYLLSRAVLPS